jgi:hypothetical protein
MATQDERLKHLYETRLKPKLEQFEPQRKSVQDKVLFVTIIIFVICVIIPVYWIIQRETLQDGLKLSFLILVFFFFSVGFFYRKLTSSYRIKFKKEVVGDIVTFVDENLTYYPERMITRAEFQKSLFEKYWRLSIDKLSGEDYVEGMLGSTAVKFSEVKAVSEHDNFVFKGLFFIFDFHKDFEGFTVVLPKLWDPFKLAYRRGPGERINLAEPEFKQEFIVYSDNQITARYVLSTSLMRRLFKFRRQQQKPVYLSFVNGTLYMGIFIYKDLFEPRIFRTLLDYNLVREFSEYMQLAKDIVEELNLNTRIWSKGIVNKYQETSRSILTDNVLNQFN